MQRLDWRGDLIEIPDGTTTCERAYDKDTTHRLFAYSNPGPMVQLLTSCGRRAISAPGPGPEVDCPDCLMVEAGIDPHSLKISDPPKPGESR